MPLQSAPTNDREPRRCRGPLLLPRLSIGSFGRASTLSVSLDIPELRAGHTCEVRAEGRCALVLLARPRGALGLAPLLDHASDMRRGADFPGVLVSRGSSRGPAAVASAMNEAGIGSSRYRATIRSTASARLGLSRFDQSDELTMGTDDAV